MPATQGYVKQLAAASLRTRPGGTRFRRRIKDNSVLTTVFYILSQILTLYYWVVILSAVIVTLVSFGVLDSRNRLVWTVGDFLARLTEPALRPIRRVLPNFGGLDLSPLVLILIIVVIQMMLPRIYGAIQGDVQGLFL